MASPKAAAQSVPELGEKLKLLFSAPKGPRNRKQFANRFPGKDKNIAMSEDAVRKWIEGEGSRDPNHVPYARFDRFVDIFAEALPIDLPRAEVIRLLEHSSEAPLKNAFLNQKPRQRWLEQVRGAPVANVKLLPVRRRPSLGMIAQIGLEPDIKGDVSFEVDRAFEISFELTPPRWVTILQKLGNAWFAFGVSPTEATYFCEANKLALPRIGKPYIFDATWLGERKSRVLELVFLMSEERLPGDILEILESSLGEHQNQISPDSVRALAFLQERVQNLELSRFAIKFE